MKAIKKYTVACFLLLVFGLFLAVKTPVSAEDLSSVFIDGVEYNLTRPQNAVASIDRVRGDHLKSELYIPSTVEYNGKNISCETILLGGYGNL